MAKELIRAIAVDDENHCLKTLEFELSRSCPDVELVRKIQDSEEAFEVLKTEEFDLLFLDIHLQATSGIELLERLMPVDFEVIFVTAYDEYAIKAFDLSAMHYLLKPVNRNKLRMAVDKVVEKRKKIDVQQYDQMLRALRDDLSQSKKIGIPVQDGVEFIDPSDILYIKADSNYSTFHFKDGRKLMVSKTLKTIEESYLKSGFIRIHKSHLVNISELSKYFKNDGGYVILSNGERLSVSRNKRQILNDLF
ncbi:LytR/AlgR family response regulator transcription factor [Portibacter lacus]|uniref:DNA-binding response regulator n=1 Tax=Portibacter lacus TaxID=1099794 RepID=A0AA37WDZ0_9BACT|nr:LytTR family DNA-binding domain-containing protein [Portibacter lacus]GLR16139.1 DNA-binding response regulator [Portibacter lacus]